MRLLLFKSQDTNNIFKFIAIINMKMDLGVKYQHTVNSCGKIQSGTDPSFSPLLPIPKTLRPHRRVTYVKVQKSKGLRDVH